MLQDLYNSQDPKTDWNLFGMEPLKLDLLQALVQISRINGANGTIS